MNGASALGMKIRSLNVTVRIPSHGDEERLREFELVCRRLQVNYGQLGFFFNREFSSLFPGITVLVRLPTKAVTHHSYNFKGRKERLRSDEETYKLLLFSMGFKSTRPVTDMLLQFTSRLKPLVFIV